MRSEGAGISDFPTMNRPVAHAEYGNMIRSLFLTAFVLCIAAPMACIAQTKLSGQVTASSACALYPQGSGKICLAVVIPLQAELRLKALSSGRKRYVAQADKDGNFQILIPEGSKSARFKVRLEALKGRFEGVTPVQDLQVTPRVVTVRGNRSQFLSFNVSHRSPEVSISK